MLLGLAFTENKQSFTTMLMSNDRPMKKIWEIILINALNYISTYASL